jgi:polar amino acid transport system substrate-binding protein
MKWQKNLVITMEAYKVNAKVLRSMKDNRHSTSLLCHALLLASLFTINNTLACKDGKATISGDTLYPPLTWKREGQLTGVSVEVVSTLLNEVGIKTIIGTPAPWKRLVHRAKLGEIDILLGVRKNQEWETFLHYIEPPLTPSVQGVFHLKENVFAYSDWQSLLNKPGGKLRGSSFGEEFDLFAKKNLHIQETNTLELNFLKLQKKRIEYFLAPLVPTQLYLIEKNLQDTITNTEKPLLLIDEYIAFSQLSGCDKYAKHFSERLKEMIDKATIDEILERYFLVWFEDIEKNSRIQQ